MAIPDADVVLFTRDFAHSAFGRGFVPYSLAAAAARQGISVLVVTLMNRPYTQSFDGNWLTERTDKNFSPENYGMSQLIDCSTADRPCPLAAEVHLEDRTVNVGAYLGEAGSCEKSAKALRLDTHALNPGRWWDQIIADELSSHVHSAVSATDASLKMEFYRLCQAYVLGIGGMRILSALSRKPQLYHLHGGAAGFQAVMQSMMLGNDARQKVLTFFTSEPDDLIFLRQDMAAEKLKDFSGDELRRLSEFAHDGYIDMDALASRRSDFTFPVGSEKIPYGLDLETFVAQELQAIVLGGNALDSSVIRDARSAAKQSLVRYLNERYKAGFCTDALTIGVLAPYGLGEHSMSLLFRADELVNSAGSGVQIIYAGEVQPNDRQAKVVAGQIYCQTRQIHPNVQAFFIRPDGIDSLVKTASGSDFLMIDPQGCSHDTLQIAMMNCAPLLNCTPNAYGDSFEIPLSVPLCACSASFRESAKALYRQIERWQPMRQRWEGVAVERSRLAARGNDIDRAIQNLLEFYPQKPYDKAVPNDVLPMGVPLIK